MKVGLYFDMRNPRAWPQDPARLYNFTLDMCEEADRLGIDSLWFTEHHLFDDGYLTQPLAFLAAVAARTKQARLGTAILIAPLRHAAHIAEEAALVDLISNGRLELGLGAGYRQPEFALFDADHAQRGATLSRQVGELRRLWDAGGVTPQPVQPRIPIWIGYMTPKGARKAGLLGENLLGIDGALVEPYRDGLIAGGHDPAIARMAGGIQAFVSDDPDRDWPTVSRHVAHQVDSYRRYAGAASARFGDAPSAVDTDALRSTRISAPSLGYFLCDTPESIAAQVLDYTRGSPVDTVYFWASIAGMPEAMVAQHVHTICTRLRPLLAAG